VQDAGRLVLGVARAEVGEEAGAQLLGLPHVDDAPVRVEHAVHGGTVLGERPYPPLQQVEVAEWERERAG
jgi:hypothetical protein